MQFKTDIWPSSAVEELVKELKLDYVLTDFEALKIALESERNYLIKTAFVITVSDEYPTALEAIAIALGFKIKKR
ncbi:MAG: histidine kinase [Bacteroidetes bacterium]|nr:histidine kinase [Bacteroidota bacterium]